MMWLLASCFLPFKFAVLLFFSSAKGSMFTLAKSYLWILWHLQHLPHQKNNKVKDQRDILVDPVILISWLTHALADLNLWFALSLLLLISRPLNSVTEIWIELWIPVLVEISSDRIRARPSVQHCFSLRSTQLKTGKILTPTLAYIYFSYQCRQCQGCSVQGSLYNTSEQLLFPFQILSAGFLASVNISYCQPAASYNLKVSFTSAFWHLVKTSLAPTMKTSSVSAAIICELWA